MNKSSIFLEQLLMVVRMKKQDTPDMRFVLSRPVQNENGAVLVISMMILMLLTFLGIAAQDTTINEVRIAMNDKVYKQAFYRADTGISYALERGLTLFPPAAIGFLTDLSPTPVDLPANTTMQYIDKGGSPRLVEIYSTGTGIRGGQATVIAGVIGVMVGAQSGSGISTGY